MQFTLDDVKYLAEVIGPIAGGVWYLRGALVRLESSMSSVNGTLTDVEGRLSKVEDHMDSLRPAVAALEERTGRHHIPPERY